MRKINMKRKGRKEKFEQQNDDEQNGVEDKSSDPKNSSEEEAKDSEGEAEPEPEGKRRKSDKRKSAASNKKAAKKDEEEAPEEEAQYEVLCALHFFAHGSYQKSVGQDFLLAISQTTVSRSVAAVSEILSTQFSRQYIRFPRNEEERRIIKREFMQKYEFPGIIGCIDCTHVAIVAPPLEHPEHPGYAYLNRKGYHSINVQLVEEVIDEKMVKGVRHYLIRWKGYEPESDTWEPESTLKCPELIKKFRDKAGEENGAEPAKKNKKSEKDKPKKEKKVVKKESKVPDVNWESDDEFEVGSILDVYFKKNGKREFLVSWKGYSHSQDSWEPEENLDCTDLIKKFMSKVESAKNVEQKELRLHRTPTERFTLSMAGSGRRLSRRFDKKQRVQYHEAE